ncbi:MAG: trigger factor [Bacilli bacterium]|nr:trigger factor [Bacilli bacterium]
MKHTIEQITPSRVKVTVDLEKEVWVEAQEKAFNKVSAKVSVPGFRPGKAPKNLLKERVNQEAVYNEAIDSVLNPTFAEIIKETKVRPFFRPEVAITKLSDTELQLAYTIITVPSAKLGAYKGLKAERPADTVTDAEVEAAVAKRFENNAELVLVEREAKMGDTVTIDFNGFLPDENGNLKPFEGGKADNYTLVLGSHSFIPGFEEAVAGMKKDESKSFKVTFPTNYVKELAGKEAQFTVVLHEVKEKKVPAADDASVKELGIKEVNTIAELKEFEKKHLLEHKVRDSEERFYNAILGQIVEGATFTLDQDIVANEAAQSENNLKKQIESNGLTFEQYLEITGGKAEDLRATFMKQAEANLKGYIVMNAIAEAEDLWIKDEDVDAEVKAMAEQYKMKEEEIRGFINRDLDGFKNNLFQKKVRGWILANSSSASAKKAAAKKEETPAEKKAAPKAAPKAAAKKPAAKKSSK